MRLLLLLGIYLVHSGNTQNTGTPCNITFTLDGHDKPTVITSPGYPVKYPSNTYCWWRLRARDSTKIETIDSMIHYSRDCLEDYMKNFDSGNIFGTFDFMWCGNKRTMETSTGRSMMILFKSDYRYETRGFQLKVYQADSSGPCNQVLLARTNEQIVESPGYPLGYFANLQCVYEIAAPDGERIEIQFEDTDIEASPDCVNDNILIADYISNTEMIQTSFCGTNSPKFQSAWRTMKISLTTNDVKERKGFRLKYKTIPRDACTLSLTATDEYSYLMSPGYSSRYFSDLNCVWTLVPPTFDPTRRIELSTEFMEVEGTYPQCSTDKVNVADYNGTVLGTICGDQLSTYSSTGPSMTVSFTTDASTERKGFRLRYRLVPETEVPISCGGNIVVSSANQTLQSPNYPFAPLDNITCVWTITAETEGSRVLLSLTDMNVEMESQCRYDSLKIFNGNTTVLSNILATWCGQSSGKYMESIGSQMTLVYTTDDSNNLRGFTAQIYSTQDAFQFCDYTLPARSTPSKLSSPRSPYNYPLNMACRYLIVADSPDLQIRVDALFSNMPQRTGRCTEDYVNVYDGKTFKSPELPSINTKLSPWCGDDLPTFISGGQYMLLVFFSDDTQPVFRNGFSLLYTQGNFTSLYRPGCGGELYATDTVQTITQPTTQFDEDMVCQWTIHANTSGHMVRITASANLQPPNSNQYCDKDSLAIFEGDRFDASKRITTMCGQLTQFLQSTGDVVAVIFTTDYKKSDASFSLQYSQTTEPLPCEFEYTATSTHFTTLDTQEDYQANEECTWLFRRSNNKVQLILTEHRNQFQQWDCTQQYVNVYDGNTEAAPLIGQYCGDKTVTVTGSADSVLVKLITGPSPVGKQFKIEYYTVSTPCSGSQFYPSTEPQYLTSTNYPFSYINGVTCSWDMLAASGPGQVVEIEVLFADLQYSPGCTRDYVELTDDIWEAPQEIGRFCGNETKVYISTHNHVSVRFHTDERGVGRGFKLSYKAVPAPTTQATASESSSNAGLIGGIVGGVVGVLVLIAAIIVIVVCVVRRSSTPTPKPVGTPQIMYNTAQNTSSVRYQNQPAYPTQLQPRPNQAYTNNTFSDSTSPATSASASAPYEYDTISPPRDGKALESKSERYINPPSRSSNPYGNKGYTESKESESSPRNGSEMSGGHSGRQVKPPPPSYDAAVTGGNGSYVQGNTFYLGKPEYI